jgi:hypothetical protein
MASRFETVPEDFLNHLGETIPGFNLERFQDRFELARMAWVGINKTNQHSHFKDAMTFTYQDLDQAFGRSNFSAVNKRLCFFNRTSNWSRDEHFTRGYMFSGPLRASMESYLSRLPSVSTTRLMMADGKAVKTIPSAIAAKDKEGVTTRAWINAKKLSCVKVDMPELAKLKTELLTACDELRRSEDTAGATSYQVLAGVERVIQAISKVSRVAMTDGAGISHIAHRYEEARSGRLYPLGISLASAQTVVKDAALTGNWEYDISNCHYAILAQLAFRSGYECLAILNYLKNKEQTRTEIAAQAGISLRQGKTCLVALMYGARASAWHENAIPREIGPAAAKQLYLSPPFRGLMQDVVEARRVILSKRTMTPKGWTTNAFGKSIVGTAKPEQQLAHLLQGVEAKALQAVINHYPDDIVIVQHDGFVSTQRLDVGAVEEAIFTATGYHLKLEERQLSADALSYFSSRLR